MMQLPPGSFTLSYTSFFCCVFLNSDLDMQLWDGCASVMCNHAAFVGSFKGRSGSVLMFSDTSKETRESGNVQEIRVLLVGFLSFRSVGSSR